ncbi:hypothetical protein FJT64_005784 [Amphibalanus amphitrite]|uniref:Uncharacterized protein n=1 Tax=Amphibalanus amphitrite TaxID=1232801 RepID=A0A6A4VZG7_AMPAM|nr:hypothetical protein FJT64_005784 [Amphibalanus amphitrite]
MLAGVNQLTQEEQRASLYSLVDDEWHRIIKFGLNITETASLSDTIRAMEDHLRSQRNVILDRRDFFRRNQQPDESFDDYLIARGLHDETAVQTLLSEKDLTLQKTFDICRARENAFVNASALAGDRLNAVSAYRRGARSYSRASMKTGNQIVSNRLGMSLPHSERCHHHGEGIYVTCTASTCEVYQRDGRRKSTSKYNTPVDMLSSHGYPTAVQRSAL